MVRFAAQSHQSVFRIAAGFLFVAVFLRSIVIYGGTAELMPVLGLLALWLVLAISEPLISLKLRWYFPVYLAVQTVLVFLLLTTPGFPDFFATLLIILSMQVMLRLDPRIGVMASQ